MPCVHLKSSPEAALAVYLDIVNHSCIHSNNSAPYQPSLQFTKFLMVMNLKI